MMVHFPKLEIKYMNPIIQFIGKNVKPRLERFNKAIPTFKVYLQKKLPTFQQGVWENKSLLNYAVFSL
jgi:hypothetical protein